MTATQKWMLTCLIILGMDATLIPYFSSDDAFKYVSPGVLFWFKVVLLGTNGGALGAKGFFTDSKKTEVHNDLPTTPQQPTNSPESNEKTTVNNTAVIVKPSSQ